MGVFLLNFMAKYGCLILVYDGMWFFFITQMQTMYGIYVPMKVAIEIVDLPMKIVILRTQMLYAYLPT